MDFLIKFTNLRQQYFIEMENTIEVVHLIYNIRLYA